MQMILYQFVGHLGGSVAFCDCSCSVCIRRSHIPCFTRKALLWDETSLA
jgi:hypothetical protein